MTHEEKAEREAKEVNSFNKLGIDILLKGVRLTELKLVWLRRHWREHLKRKTATEAKG
jgi:hypothetical protein